MISLSTPRFGDLKREENELLHFPCGIFGFELHRQWLLLGDREHGALYWLQNVEDTDLCLAVVEPREFLPDYRLCVQPGAMATLSETGEPLVVLSVLTEYQQQLCLNLRQPVVLHPLRRVGLQVECTDEQPLQYALPAQPAPLRQSA